MNSSSDTATRADRITAIVLFILGIAFLYGGFVMDRLETRQIHPSSIPGLLPMLLGAILAFLASVLYLRAAGADASVATGSRAPTDPEPDSTPCASPSHARVLTAGAWSVIYALLLVGNLPFVIATALYIGGFVAGFGWDVAPTFRLRVLLLARSLALAVLGSWAIATLFSEAFLVRLP